MQKLSFIVMRTLTLLAVMLPLSLAAQDKAANLVESWVFVVKPGHQAAFETAFRKHGELRKSSGEMRNWDVYTQEVGDALNTYAVRSCCFNWSDQDKNTDWNMSRPEIMEDWTANVQDHLESVSHYYYELDMANSVWGDSQSPHMVGVTEFAIASGKNAQFHAARAELSQVAINQGWAANGKQWSWYDRIGGTPMSGLAIPFDNFAGMTAGEQSFSAFLASKMGEEKAAGLMEKFASSVSSSSYMIWVHRPDLSVKKD
jgi:hypothetical protein